jgi:hypothetical protein
MPVDIFIGKASVQPIYVFKVNEKQEGNGKFLDFSNEATEQPQKKASIT